MYLAIIAVIAVLTIPSQTGMAYQNEINLFVPIQPSAGWVTETLGMSYAIYDLVLDSSGSAKIIAKPSGNFAVLIEQTGSGWVTTILDMLPYGESGNVSAIMDANDFILAT